MSEQKELMYYERDTQQNISFNERYTPTEGKSVVETLGHPEFKEMKTQYPKKDAEGKPIDLVQCAVFPVKFQEKTMDWIMNVTPLKTSKGEWNSTLYAQVCQLISENGGDAKMVLEVHRRGTGTATRYILVKR